MSNLADLIRGAAVVDGEPMSNRTIAALTNVSPETINRIMRGDGTPDVATIDRIADALGLPRQTLRDASGLPRGEQGAYEPPEESRLLDARQRAALDELIRSFVATPRTVSADVPVTDIATKRASKPKTAVPKAARDTAPSEGRRRRKAQDDAAETPQD